MSIRVPILIVVHPGLRRPDRGGQRVIAVVPASCLSGYICSTHANLATWQAYCGSSGVQTHLEFWAGPRPPSGAGTEIHCSPNYGSIPTVEKHFYVRSKMAQTFHPEAHMK